MRKEASDCSSRGSNCVYHMDLCIANLSPSIITGLDFRINDSEVVRFRTPVQTCFLDFIVSRFSILRTMDPQDWWANYPLTCYSDFMGIHGAPSFFQFWNTWCISYYFLNEWFSSSLISTLINIWSVGFHPFMSQQNYNMSLVIGHLGKIPIWIFLKYPSENFVPRPVISSFRESLFSSFRESLFFCHSFFAPPFRVISDIFWLPINGYNRDFLIKYQFMDPTQFKSNNIFWLNTFKHISAFFQCNISWLRTVKDIFWLKIVKDRWFSFNGHIAILQSCNGPVYVL